MSTTSTLIALPTMEDSDTWLRDNMSLEYSASGMPFSGAGRNSINEVAIAVPAEVGQNAAVADTNNIMQRESQLSLRSDVATAQGHRGSSRLECPRCTCI